MEKKVKTKNKTRLRRRRRRVSDFPPKKKAAFKSLKVTKFHRNKPSLKSDYFRLLLAYSLPCWQHRDVNYQGTLSCCWTFSAYQAGHFVGSRLLTDWITSSECSSSNENNKGLNTALKGQKCFVGQVVKDIQVILLGLCMPQVTRNITEPEVKSQGWHKLYTIINVRRCSSTFRWTLCFSRHYPAAVLSWSRVNILAKL